VENNKFPGIRSQLTTVWRQFQPRQHPSKLSSGGDRNAESEHFSFSHERQEEDFFSAAPPPAQQIAGANSQAIVTSNSTSEDDRFSEISTPISRLNLPQLKVDRWSIFWAILAAMVGGTGITSYLLLIAVPPTSNCRNISPLSTDSERLYCAQVGAETKEVPKLRAAVGLVQGWTDSHPLYGEAQRLLKSWSQDLMRIGTKQLNEGKIDVAIATLKIIPSQSPIYSQAQATIAKWSDQAQDSANIDVKFDRAMKSGDWNQAFVILQSVQRMRGNYWNSFKHEQMSAKLVLERDGWDKLQEAKDALIGKEFSSYTVGAKRPDLVKTTKDKVKIEEPLPTEPEPIVKAMQLANQINPTTYVYQEGQQLRSTWSKQLMTLSIGAYKTQNFNEAISIAQKVPQDVSVYQEAQDWVKLNRSHIWAGKRHMLALMDAIAQVKQIPKTSSIYTLARNQQSNWQGMLKHQTQFQWAKTIASFQQPATLALAIDTAKQIPAHSEVGTMMQSEIATWNRQIQTIDNRVILARARQIVNNGASLANLQAAVRLAGKITADRPMGAEATAAVGEWNEKIQTIEDTPIFNRAQAIANSGNLTQAIEIANQIAPGRALYQTAQSSVRYWSLELQEIADRQTLEKAIAIYRQGQISTAIDLAATINRRSPIYGDARAYVADWRLLLSPRSMRN
jgi:hypothetical protein